MILTTSSDIGIYTCNLEADIRLGALGKDVWVPNINSSKWGDEAWVNLNPRWFDVKAGSVFNFSNNCLNVTTGDVKIKSWPLSKDVLEYAVCFSSVPVTDSIVFEIQQSKGLEWHFQPALTEEQLKHSYRPDRAIGSHAVYFGKKNNEYKTGKFAHFYRWECIDAKGNKAWCGDCVKDGGNLIIPLPVDWLKKAAYPVVCMGAGDTFGYTSKGGTEGAPWYPDYIEGSSFTGGAGTLDSITAYFKQYSAGTPTIKCAAYEKTGAQTGTLVSGGDTVEWTMTSSWDDWKTFNCTSPPIISTADYWLLWWWSISNAVIYYDSVALGGSYQGQAYGAWPATVSLTDEGLLFSIYATYTPSGGGGGGYLIALCDQFNGGFL